jgi:hypothetical protein
MKGHNFGWKAFWDLYPEWSHLKLRYVTVQAGNGGDS